jgi:hypothetical protein
MTSRERVEATFRHGEPDRTPVFEYVLLSPVADRLDLAEMLGHDLMYLWPNPLPGRADTGPHAAPTAPADDPVERLRRRNQEAAAADPSPPEESLRVYALAKEEMARRGMDLPLLAPAYAHGVWTGVDLMMTMALEPEVAREHFALATQRSLAAAEKYTALGVDLIGVGGDFAGQRPIISPAAYRTFIVPEVRNVADRIHAAGRRAVNASDGNQVTLLGNLDCGTTLSFASPEEVWHHTIQCLKAGLGRGGHILCASNAITASVPLENYLAVVQAHRDFFGLTSRT